jgi:hypothetical protein
LPWLRTSISSRVLALAVIANTFYCHPEERSDVGISDVNVVKAEIAAFASLSRNDGTSGAIAVTAGWLDDLDVLLHRWLIPVIYKGRLSFREARRC